MKIPREENALVIHSNVRFRLAFVVIVELLPQQGQPAGPASETQS